MSYVLKKLFSTMLTLLLVSFITFFVFQIIPGDPVTSILGTDTTPEREEQLREELGLNESVGVRYVNWLTGFAQGDLGTSYKYSMPVSQLLSGKVLVTMALGGLSFLFIVLISVPIGILGARFGKSSRLDTFDITNQVVMSIPSFILGIFIVYIFGLVLKIFTPGAYVDYTENVLGFIIYLIAPALAIAIPRCAMIIKILKSEIQSQMHSDYVRTARSKGDSETNILFHHVLKNAVLPVLTLLGMIVAEILAGSLIIEQVFNIPGMGRILITSISTRDYPVVQAVVMYIAIIVIVMNMIVDIMYRVIDPRTGE